MDKNGKRIRTGDTVKNSYDEHVVQSLGVDRVYYTTGGFDMLRSVRLVKSTTPSLDNLSVDDVVIDEYGDEYTVAAVHGRVVELEDSDGHFTGTYTVKDLKDNDWTVKPAEADLTEVTLEQVAKAMKVDVSKLRIKE